MTISATPSGRYRVSVKWAAKHKHIGMYDDVKEARVAEIKALEERPPTIPALRGVEPNMDTLGYLSKAWGLK